MGSTTQCSGNRSVLLPDRELMSLDFQNYNVKPLGLLPHIFDSSMPGSYSMFHEKGSPKRSRFLSVTCSDRSTSQRMVGTFLLANLSGFIRKQTYGRSPVANLFILRDLISGETKKLRRKPYSFL